MSRRFLLTLIIVSTLQAIQSAAQDPAPANPTAGQGARGRGAGGGRGASVGAPAQGARGGPAAQNANSISPVEFVIDPPTLINLGFEWFIQGDEKRNAT